jgi:two-component system C4-dicarboxylate transport sensor histidine kinase DctB
LDDYRQSLLYRSLERISIWALFVALAAGGGMAAYFYTERAGYAGLSQSAMHQLDLYAAGIDGELSKYESLASMVDLEPQVLRLLHDPRDAALRDSVNRWLLNLNVRAGSTAIIVMNKSGVALASSNWYEPDSFVGQDLPISSLYENTAHGGETNAFVADRSRGAPLGYFARAIRNGSELMGVVAVKVSLATVESTWIEFAASSSREKLLVIDENGVVIMSSNPQWRFRTLAPLTPAQRVDLARSERYPSVQMEPLGLMTESVLHRGGKLVRLDDPGSSGGPQRFLSEEHAIFRPHWRLVTLSDVSPVERAARHAALGAASGAGVVALLLLHLRQRRRAVLQQLTARQALQRANDELEQRVEERTMELRELNTELVGEVAERERTEQTLREAQAELIRAGRLALLGQMSAAITHEINQPLTALRALSDNSRRLLAAGRLDNVERNLVAIAEMTERMGRITTQLKTFARKVPLVSTTALLGHSIGSTLELVRERLQAQGVEVEIEVPEGLRVVCDSFRLEQVLLNLMCNALDAMKDMPTKRLTVRAEPGDGAVRVSVSDTGTGLSESTLSHLFEPFFSTKPPGEGLGLGLVISSGIVQEFGSSLRASNLPNGGAVFEFDLQLEREVSDVV